MNKKMKKYFLGFAGLTMAALPLVSAACGKTSSKPTTPTNPSNPSTPGNPGGTGLDFKSYINSITEDERIENRDEINPGVSGKFNQSVKETLVIGHTFSESGAQAKAVASLVKVYNNLVDSRSQDLIEPSKAKKWNIKGLGSGYQGGAESIDRSLQGRDTDSFVNLTINYAAVAASLAEKDMLLSFNSNGNDNLDITNYSSSFTVENYTIENVANPSTVLLPQFKSTLVLALNAPVLAYIFNTIVENGGSVDASATDFVNKIKEAGKKDEAAVKSIWGAPSANVREVVNGFVITDAIFKSYSAMLDFADMSQKLFVNSSNPDSELHIVGFDSAVSIYETAIYSELNAKDSEMIAAVNVDSNTKHVNIDYRPLHNTNSPASVKSAEVVGRFATSVKNNSLKLLPGGQFASTDQINHKFAFSIGSTAGYSHNFVTGASSAFEISGKPTLRLNNDLSKDTGTFRTVQKTPSGKNFKAVANAIGYVGKYKNAILPADAELAAYQLKALDAESEAKLREMYAQAKEDNSSVIALVNYDKKTPALYSTFKESTHYAELVTSGTTEYLVLFFKDAQGNNLENELAALGYQKSEKSLQQLLEKHELFTLPTPLKWKATSPKNVVFGQGPSIIGIHANETDDEATRLFVKWLVTSTTKYNFDGKGTFTPSEYLEKAMNYINPTNGFQNKTAEQVTAAFDDNAYLKTAFEMFKQASDSSDTVIYSEPGTTKANAFRQSIESAFNSLQDSKGTMSYANFIDKIQIGK
ncbi:P68 family surface lipoprotein [Mycoplasmopsis gallopavonis]|uniref:Lipoprotein n=1 Tax=Mycoplasmopsis gallopavonis TaxID=76629 RepID=A0A449B0J4_9BACT|nr:P80 family lipoprotein [Mycoplasmopsis gallopavonis]RIV17005.1 hypothetical protein D1113_00065 [Mycoplasmopsis gallopavonis]VEU73290.1 lipoprotein [Mycoplasmopsis gallopavonis]